MDLDILVKKHDQTKDYLKSDKGTKIGNIKTLASIQTNEW